MKNLIIFFILLSTIAYSQTIQYVQSEEIFNNPERGIQKYSDAKASNYQLLTESTLNGYKNGADKVTVIYRCFYLNTFFTSEISQSYLNNMQTDFNRIRNSGLKVIIRFAYSFSTSTAPFDPTKEQMLLHIEQLKPILELNKDVILLHQLGFIGAYGEWYYTSQSSTFGNQDYNGYTNAQWANRKQIVEAALLATPQNIPLQLRYPYAKTKMYGNTYLGRIGLYNDAFLNVWGDEGFYAVSCQTCLPSVSEQNYVINQTANLPMTGESNGLNQPRTDCQNALIEFDKYNWSTKNRDYFPAVWNNWVSQGCYSEIVKRLGYRFVLKAITFTNSQNELTAQFDIKNVGFANTFTNRNAYLVFRNTAGQNYPYLLQTNIKQWTGDYYFTENVNLADLPSGNYTTYLWMPDTNLSSRADYSIRLANTNVWENGYNNLNYSFVKESLGIVENNNFELFNFDKVFVYNTIGQYVSDDKNLSNLPIGIYIIKGQKDDKFYTYKKIKK